MGWILFSVGALGAVYGIADAVISYGPQWKRLLSDMGEAEVIKIEWRMGRESGE